MHFVLQTPSLEHLAGVKIVTHLWNQSDIFTQILPLPDYEERRDAMEEKVKSKVRALPLAEPCKKQLLTLITPLRKEIITWCDYHYDGNINVQFSDNLSPQQVCWTMHGTIDYAKTAQLIVKDERVDVEGRYEIACINCLEDEARQLFANMSGKRMQEYVNKVRKFRSMEHDHLIVFFTCTLISDMDHLRKYFQPMMRYSHSSLNKCLFEAMLRRGNRATIEYLFKKLNHREKVQVLKKCADIIPVLNCPSSTSSILYYLSMMNEEQQEHLFRKCTEHILVCLLSWPLQSLFVEAARCGWHLMENYARTGVLPAILFKISNGFGDFDYAHLFRECWRLSSAESKRFYFHYINIVDNLMQTKTEEFIKIVLKEAPSHKILPLCRRNSKYRLVLMDESVISDVALMECKETVALISSNDEQDAEKRLRTKFVSHLVDRVVESRNKTRQDCRCIRNFVLEKFVN